jgi:hypothetical protein
VKLSGAPLELSGYRAETVTNRRFQALGLDALDRFFLPHPMTSLLDEPPLERQVFVEDDNRGAILPEPVATLDGMEFYLSVKGVGSTLDPYSWRSLDRTYVAELARDAALTERLQREPPSGVDRFITGELWLRGSPYGGQGLEHATTALRVSEMADLTDLHGFLIAPVVKVAQLPPPLESQIRHIHWYRKYPGRIVQELRLVPSNVRVYFHAKSTVGNSIGHVFQQFAIDSDAKALRFETNFVRSTVALLTLFARTLTFDSQRRRYSGLDFHDVWLDKDAVVAPDGSAYFVDLEGIDLVSVEKDEVREKVEDQIYRSLYEMMFAYEQIERERNRRFGGEGSRKRRFAGIVREALAEDPFVGLHEEGPNLELIVRNNCHEESLYTRFRMVEG